MNRLFRCSCAALVYILGLGAAAHAAVYSNTTSPIMDESSFGSPDTTSYGEVFTAPAGTLLSWTFWSDAVITAGNLKLVVASWDGSAAVGPALYTSAPIYDSGAINEALIFSAINLNLASSNSYIAYMTVAGVTSPVSGATIQLTTTDPLGGEFAFDNSVGADPLTTGNNYWKAVTSAALVYSATFGSASVPEPSSILLLGSALAGVGFVSRRRRRV